MKGREYSTQEVANLVGISKRQLYRWLDSGKLPEPKQVKAGEVMLRVWSDEDVKRAAELKAQLRRGRPHKNLEVNVDQRLLSFYSQLNWYGRALKLTDKEREALYTLQSGLLDRLRERGLKW